METPLPEKDPQRNSPFRMRPNFFAAGLGAAVIVVALALFPDADIPSFAPQEEAFFKMDFSKEANGGFSEGDLSDYTPMFLPTRWNYRRGVERLSATDEFGGVFSASLESAEDSDKTDFTPRPADEAPLDSVKDAAMDISSKGFFRGFGSVDAARGEAKPSAVGVRIIDMFSGKTVKDFQMDIDGLPQDSLWSSVEFMLSKSPLGGRPTPTLTKRSDSDRTDAILSKATANNPQVRALPGGHYKIVFTR